MAGTRREFLAGLGKAAALVGGGSLLPGCSVTSRCGDSGAAPSRSPDPSGAAPDASDGPSFAALDGLCADAAPIEVAEFEGRIERVRAELRGAGRRAVVVEAGVDMRYLGGPAWGRSERPLLLVVPVSDHAPTLIGPAFEANTLEARRGPLSVELRTWEEHESPYALVRRTLDEAGSSAGGPVATGPAMRSFVAEGLRTAGGQWAVDTCIGGCRSRKSPAELALLRRANEATKAALAAAAPHAREGMHEREFAEIVRAAQHAAGLESVWVLALFGPNAAFPHGTPEGRTLAAGDLILVDTGGFLHGYASDITRTWAFPDPAAIDEERRRAWQVVHDAQAAALEAIGPGVRCASVDARARAVIAAAGFDGDYHHFSHRLGHGIGMEVHEAPYLVRDNARVLEPGNTMSNEPGVYLPGAFGIRLEDIVAVGEEGHEVFGPLAASLDSRVGP